MFHINIHCRPNEKNAEYFGTIAGAYAVVLIDYKDIEGAFALAKFYVEQDQWEVIEVEDEYFIYDTKEDLGKDYYEYFHEVKEYGYSLIFNLYENDDYDNNQ